MLTKYRRELVWAGLNGRIKQRPNFELKRQGRSHEEDDVADDVLSRDGIVDPIRQARNVCAGWVTVRARTESAGGDGPPTMRKFIRS